MGWIYLSKDQTVVITLKTFECQTMRAACRLASPIGPYSVQLVRN